MLDAAQLATWVQTIGQTSCSAHDQNDMHDYWHLWLLSMRGKLCSIRRTVVQQDGTLKMILDRRLQLEQILSQLCGVGVPKEADDTARAALAEAILMLVSSLPAVHSNAVVIAMQTKAFPAIAASAMAGNRHGILIQTGTSRCP